MSETNSRKTIALLTTGALLIVLSVLMPAAYADLNTDPHVTGSGSGSYSCSLVTVNANIAFTATAKGMTAPWLGTWIITAASTGSTLASGSITGSGIALVPSGFFLLTGVETFGCSPPNQKIEIDGTCGTSSVIHFGAFHVPEAGSFTGSTHCGFPGNH